MYNVYNSNGELEKSGFPSYEGAATFCISRGRYGDWQIKSSSYGKRDFYRRIGLKKTSLKMVKSVICSILEKYQITSQEFFHLEEIGGHKQYHLEGNALEHTMLVYYAACDMFPSNWEMQRVALLHDIGKIYTSIKKDEDDWEYPDHSTCGALKGILCKFIPLDDPHFVDYQWLIRNHIKPLFWRKTGTNLDTNPWEKDKLDPKLANIDNLRRLAICDLRGSLSVNGNEELIAYLSNLTL